MAEIAYAFATSHSPQLTMPPETWVVRGDTDRQRKELTYRDGTYTFAQLLEMRRSEVESFKQQSRLEVSQQYFARSQAALDRLAARFSEMKPDVLVVIGDDQHEWFRAHNQPALSVLCGDGVVNRKFDPAEYSNGIEIAAPGWRPPQDHTYPIQTDLALHIVDQSIEGQFDVSISAESPKDAKGPMSITHSVGFIARRILRDQMIPIVPILLNTFYPPNQVKPGRCFDFGRLIAKAIRSWAGPNANKRVALCASGGLSHYVVDEPWDRKMLDAMLKCDEQAMRSEPNSMFQGGTSETKNWIALCGAMSGAGFQMNLLDYVPCYRSEAGTGNAMAFATWEQ